MPHWSDTYPHEVNASVLLYEGKIYSYKIGNQFWEDPRMVKMRFSDMKYMHKFTVDNRIWTVHNDKEHEDVFTTHAKEWFKQWEISPDHIGGPAYER